MAAYKRLVVDVLPGVSAPTLLIVNDMPVLRMNREAIAVLKRAFEIVRERNPQPALIRKIPLRPDAPAEAPWFEPDGPEPKPHLIERPITIGRQKSRAAAQEFKLPSTDVGTTDD